MNRSRSAVGRPMTWASTRIGTSLATASTMSNGPPSRPLSRPPSSTCSVSPAMKCSYTATARWEKAPGDDLAQLGVLGRVGVDDRAPGGHVLVGRLLEGDPAGRGERPHVPAGGHDVGVPVHAPETGPGVREPGRRRMPAQPGELAVRDPARPQVEIGQVHRRCHDISLAPNDLAGTGLRSVRGGAHGPGSVAERGTAGGGRLAGRLRPLSPARLAGYPG